MTFDRAKDAGIRSSTDQAHLFGLVQIRSLPMRGTHWKAVTKNNQGFALSLDSRCQASESRVGHTVLRFGLGTDLFFQQLRGANPVFSGRTSDLGDHG
jgi:hypothetical protein